MTIKSHDDLTSILDAPLEKWRVFLHPSQEKLVSKKFNGPARVLGGAGTGKTVVAMHRARHLAETLFTDKTDRILFTTYTANLAQNVEQILAQPLRRRDGADRGRPPARLGRAVHEDPGRRLSRSPTDDEIDQCWEEASSRGGRRRTSTPGFLRRSGSRSSRPTASRPMPEYLQGAPHGPGPDADQAAAGQGLEGLRAIPLGPEGQGQARVAAGDPGHPPAIWKRRSRILPYRAVVVDESQDFHPEEWKLIRALVPAGAERPVPRRGRPPADLRAQGRR